MAHAGAGRSLARDRAALLAVVVGQCAALAVLHVLPAPRLALTDPIGWADHVGLEIALAGACRAAAVAVVWWLLAATVLAIVAAGRDEGRVAAVARRVVPVRLRALVARAVATSLVTLTAVGPATTLGGVPAAASEPVVLVTVDGDGTLLPPGLHPPVPAPVPSGTPDAGPSPADRAPRARDETPVAPPSVEPTSNTMAEHVVRPGEHLWAIAARRVAAASGRPETSLPDHEVAPYWARLVAANRDRLRSGDPDLIHPGERVHLPALERTQVAP